MSKAIVAMPPSMLTLMNLLCRNLEDFRREKETAERAEEFNRQQFERLFLSSDGEMLIRLRFLKQGRAQWRLRGTDTWSEYKDVHEETVLQGILFGFSPDEEGGWGFIVGIKDYSFFVPVTCVCVVGFQNESFVVLDEGEPEFEIKYYGFPFADGPWNDY